MKKSKALYLVVLLSLIAIATADHIRDMVSANEPVDIIQLATRSASNIDLGAFLK
ncbi:MAG: hypothetical protein AAGC47_08725 [Bacteroidota bacterium]